MQPQLTLALPGPHVGRAMGGACTTELVWEETQEATGGRPEQWHGTRWAQSRAPGAEAGSRAIPRARLRHIEFLQEIVQLQQASIREI